MLALIVSRSGVLDAAGAQAQKLPVILLQGGIHAGEIDGKDAGFLALREALDGRAARGTLDKLVVIFVPVFNVDGHERYRAWNRPNQRGPEEMGWRTTAQNYNLNRDYMKADAAEMQAMLGLMTAWDPLVLADLHVTDGAQFEHGISINVEPLYSGDAKLREAGRECAHAGDMLEAAGRPPLPLPIVRCTMIGSGLRRRARLLLARQMPLRNRSEAGGNHSGNLCDACVKRDTIYDLLDGSRATATSGENWPSPPQPHSQGSGPNLPSRPATRAVSSSFVVTPIRARPRKSPVS